MNNLTIDDLRSKSKKEVLNFIREKLAFDSSITSQLRLVDKDEFRKEHRRFEMSGYEDVKGWCTIFNTSILNQFADLGIYDYTSYLFLDFFKGHGTLYLQYFNRPENLEYELGGYTTSEIIYKVLELTVFSDKMTRRRD